MIGKQFIYLQFYNLVTVVKSGRLQTNPCDLFSCKSILKNKVAIQLTDHITQNKLPTTNQSGFWTFKNKLSLRITNLLYFNIDKGLINGIILFLHQKKVFDWPVLY